MQYKKLYRRLILRAQQQARDDTYRERHHCIPRCMGGADTRDNLVWLTVREHRHAHLLLYKIHKHEHPNLIFAIAAFHEDANPGRKQFKKDHAMPKWVRKTKHLLGRKLINDFIRRHRTK